MKNFGVTLLILFWAVFIVFANTSQESNITVLVENSFVSPSLNPDASVVFILSSQNVKKIKSWALTIYNENTEIVKKFSGEKNLPQKIIWNCLNYKNQQIKDGKYSYILSVNIGKTMLSFSEKNIVIDSVAPFGSIRTSDSVYFVDANNTKINKSINIYPSAGDENGIDYDKSYIKVINFKNKEIKRFKLEKEIPSFIIWDGVDDIYDILLPVGNYRIVMFITDKSGNIFFTDSDISIIKEPIADYENENTNIDTNTDTDDNIAAKNEKIVTAETIKQNKVKAPAASSNRKSKAAKTNKTNNTK